MTACVQFWGCFLCDVLCMDHGAVHGCRCMGACALSAMHFVCAILLAPPDGVGEEGQGPAHAQTRLPGSASGKFCQFRRATSRVVCTVTCPLAHLHACLQSALRYAKEVMYVFCCCEVSFAGLLPPLFPLCIQFVCARAPVAPGTCHAMPCHARHPQSSRSHARDGRAVAVVTSPAGEVGEVQQHRSSAYAPRSKAKHVLARALFVTVGATSRMRCEGRSGFATTTRTCSHACMDMQVLECKYSTPHNTVYA